MEMILNYSEGAVPAKAAEKSRASSTGANTITIRESEVERTADSNWGYC